MRLSDDLHLAYCTNIHAGESWAQIAAALDRYVLAVRERVCPGRPYAIGLRLSARAAAELANGQLDAFRRWLDRHDCYVFTINGFPYGDFHGTRVKEQVYAPDWTTPERLAYTRQVADLLAAIVPDGIAGSVSTVPCSFKAFIQHDEQVTAMVNHLRAAADYLAEITDRTGREIHLGLEPEPLCFLESTAEAVDFFARLHDGASAAQQARLRRHLGINYDTCHLAVEYESAGEGLTRLADAGIRLSKLHLSSALRVGAPARHATALAPFVEPTYFHQTIVARQGEILRRHADLDEALAAHAAGADPGDEWRVHFHVPLHAAPEAPLHDTRDHLQDALTWLAAHRGACSHLEMETYTWDVLPTTMKRDVVEQLTREYAWTLGELCARGLAPREP